MNEISEDHRYRPPTAVDRLPTMATDRHRLLLGRAMATADRRNPQWDRLMVTDRPRVAESRR